MQNPNSVGKKKQQMNLCMASCYDSCKATDEGTIILNKLKRIKSFGSQENGRVPSCKSEISLVVPSLIAKPGNISMLWNELNI